MSVSTRRGLCSHILHGALSEYQSRYGKKAIILLDKYHFHTWNVQIEYIFKKCYYYYIKIYNKCKNNNKKGVAI